MISRWSTRPRWQHRDANVRRDSVALGDDPELLAQLPNLAREDPDAKVRTAALRRAADLRLAQSCARDDADAGVRETAQTLYRELLGGLHQASPPLTERLHLLAGIEDRVLREHLARHAAEPELREAALAKHVRPGLISECIVHDPDADLRLRLLQRIDDADTLQRIAGKTRRHDKTVSQLASQRVMTLRVAAGDPEAIQHSAEQCCQRLEQARTQDRDGRLATLEATDALWRSLGNVPTAALATRHAHARAQLEAINTAAAQTSIVMPTPAPTAPRAAEPLHASAPVTVAPLDTQRLAAEARFQASVAEGREYAPAVRVSTPEKVDVNKLLDTLESALDDGDLGATRHAEHAIEQLPASALNGKQSARWQRARARGNELLRWQQWSTRRQRRQLCVDAEQMSSVGLHPDALSNRVRELRAAWQKLDALESSPPSGTDLALKRRFNGLCQRALSAAKPYFKARDALRNQHTEDTCHLLGESTAALSGDAQPDWRQLEALHKRLHVALRDLDKVDPAARKKLAGALHKQLRQLDARLAAHYTTIQDAHGKLIEQAQALVDNAAADAPAQVRELQAQWQALGPGRRDRDNRQWRSFRAACDAIFAQRDQARQAANERDQAQHAHARQLIEQLRQSTSVTDHDALQRARRTAETAWRELALRDRNLSKDWRDTLAAVDARLATLQRQANRAQFEQAFAQIDGPATDNPRPALAAALRQRPRTPADQDAARDVLVRCEALAGIDSPAEDQQRRVALRLQKLQAALGAGERRSRSEELEAILAEWIILGPLPADATHLATRMQHALDMALDQL